MSDTDRTNLDPQRELELRQLLAELVEKGAGLRDGHLALKFKMRSGHHLTAWGVRRFRLGFDDALTALEPESERIERLKAVPKKPRGRPGLTVEQLDILRRIWRSDRWQSARDVCRRFASETGRSISDGTALKYDPWLAPPIEGEIIPEPKPKPEPEPERGPESEPEPEPDDSPPLAQPVIRDDGTDPTMRPGDPTPEEIAAATAEIKRIHVESLMAGDVLHAGLSGKPSELGRLGFSRKRGRLKGVIRS